jgi:hypothetical protein
MVEFRPKFSKESQFTFHDDPKKKYLMNINRMQKQIQVSNDSQATRFPVYKDAQSKWSFNYAEEYKKRFRATEVWNP